MTQGAVAETDRCPDANIDGKTAELMEVDVLSQFFNSGCRPGPWSANSSVDTDLKNRYQSLCSLCGVNSNCASYTRDMGVTVARVRNGNRYRQALQCLTGGNNPGVAYVSWQHVREYFNIPSEMNPGSNVCSYDSTNKYYGNAGAVACLADPDSDVAFVELENIDADLQAAGLQASQI
ncbi:unnamed protein product [Pieris brassicae]|uniref:Transferrin-like domain-containing protein n=1 Tax=Pieris brassicae TaxID=7116 RepID=A0A9P0XGM6_PIEBR|nr:unnamed protein product [Pieris brassicae]